LADLPAQSRLRQHAPVPDRKLYPIDMRAGRLDEIGDAMRAISPVRHDGQPCLARL
jgi:hypothetical protein